MLAIFAEKFYKYKIISKRFTYKSIQNHNLDYKYNNIFSKVYWFRRKQQLDYEEYLGSKIINLNYILTSFIFLIIKKF